jgi:two-component system phosphate regulon sensor histidine kinase PhoR
MNRVWAKEALRIGGILALAALAGASIGHPTAAALAAALGYLGWHLFHLNRLHRWLSEDKKFQPPEARGAWGQVFNDIYRLQASNRKRKRKLARYLRRFQEATSAWPDGAVVLDEQGTIEWANPRARALLGLRIPQDIGRRVTYFVRHPGFSMFLSTGGGAEPLQLPSPVDPELHLAVYILPYGKKQQRLLIARDVTHVRRLEQVRRDFVANVSHELRTPLTVLNGYLETLNEAIDEFPPGWADSLGAMHKQAARMRRIVEDLLLLARLEAEGEGPSAETVPVPDLLAAIVEEARRFSGDLGHRITLESQPLALIGSPGEIRSAFSNLVNNAVQYTPPNGEIRIRWSADDDGAHLEVTDTGPGIEAHHIPRLTERFYRVDVGRSRESGGTGLGLAIVKHVLQRHDAQLQIESIPGHGSTFRCDFPNWRVASLVPDAEAVS